MVNRIVELSLLVMMIHDTMRDAMYANVTDQGGGLGDGAHVHQSRTASVASNRS